MVAKELVKKPYSRAAEHSYFVGCSTGGREAMIMSRRFPTHFDGLVAGAPAMRTGYSNLGMRSVSVALNEIAARDTGGTVIRGSGLSDGDKRLIVDSVLEACDADNGVEDGMIFAPQLCDFSPAELVCSDGKSSECLSAGQAAAVEKALSGPRGASGLLVYPGYFCDTGIAASGAGVIPGVLRGAASPVGPRVPPTSQGRRRRGGDCRACALFARRHASVDELENVPITWWQAIVLSWDK